VAFSKRLMSITDTKHDPELISILNYKSNIKDNITLKINFNMKLGLKDLAEVIQIALSLLPWVINYYLITLDRTYNKEDYKEAIIVISLHQ
jgi:hypothetical protein